MPSTSNLEQEWEHHQHCHQCQTAKKSRRKWRLILRNHLKVPTNNEMAIVMFGMGSILCDRKKPSYGTNFKKTGLLLLWSIGQEPMLFVQVLDLCHPIFKRSDFFSVHQVEFQPLSIKIMASVQTLTVGIHVKTGFKTSPAVLKETGLQLPAQLPENGQDCYAQCWRPNS